MNVSTIIHVFGTLALIIILFTTIMYTSIRTNMLIYENQKKTLQSIVNSVSYQILAMFVLEINTSIYINYPIESLYDRKYNIVITSGERVSKLYKHIVGLNTTYIYIIAIDPVNNNYAYTNLVLNSSAKPIYIREYIGGRSCSRDGYIIFSSDTIVYIWKFDYINYIVVSCELKGLKTS